MRKIITTSYPEAVPEDRPAIYISTGQGNRAGVPEVHLHYTDPFGDVEIPLGWFRRDDLIAALLDPDPEPQRLGRAGVQA
jgi:hypothetical protein